MNFVGWWDTGFISIFVVISEWLCHRHKIVVASHFNGWKRMNAGRAFRYAISCGTVVSSYSHGTCKMEDGRCVCDYVRDCFASVGQWVALMINEIMIND